MTRKPMTSKGAGRLREELKRLKEHREMLQKETPKQ